MIQPSHGFSPLLQEGFQAFTAPEPVLVRQIAGSPISLILYLWLEGRNHWALRVDYAFFHAKAESFAIECVNHASSVGKLIPANRWHSYLKFSVGAFFGWRPGEKRWSEASETRDAFTERVLSEIAIKLLPALNAVGGESALVEMLLDADEQGHRTWDRTNAALRAAVILYMADRLNLDYSTLEPQLIKHARGISQGIEGRTVAGLAVRFLAQVRDALKMRAARNS